jgi:hypothetical protein
MQPSHLHNKALNFLKNNNVLVANMHLLAHSLNLLLEEERKQAVEQYLQAQNPTPPPVIPLAQQPQRRAL